MYTPRKSKESSAPETPRSKTAPLVQPFYQETAKKNRGVHFKVDPWTPIDGTTINQSHGIVLYMTLVRDARISVSGRKGTAFATIMEAETLIVLPYTFYALTFFYLQIYQLSIYLISYISFLNSCKCGDATRK